MTFEERIWYWKANLYNAILRFLIPKTYLRAGTIWAMMAAMDKQVSRKEMEHYIREYKRGKEQGYEF